MRTSPLKAEWTGHGAVFSQRYGNEVIARLGDRSEEYRAIRNAAGLTDFSFVRVFRVAEEPGMDFLDRLVAGNVAKIRFGRVLHTFLANDAGEILADCYVANNDEEYLFFCEAVVPDAELDQVLASAGGASAGLAELSPDHVLLSLDGFKAWQIAKSVFGADVLGLPYLSIESYPFEGETLRLIRGGKTSEFGYLLLASIRVAHALYTRLNRELQSVDGRLCGVDIHNDLRLEGRFFNVHSEGVRVKDPLVLGLQWMVDFDKETFLGAEALFLRRSQGVVRKIVGVTTVADLDDLCPGRRVLHEGEAIGEIVAGAFSEVLGQPVGLAVLHAEVAFSGLTFALEGVENAVLATISMPPIMPRSLGVKLDEM